MTVAFSILCVLSLCCCALVGMRVWRRRKRKAFSQVRESSVEPGAQMGDVHLHDEVIAT